MLVYLVPNTSYVAGSTRFNVQELADINGDCPLLNHYLLNSPGEEAGIIAYHDSGDIVSLSYQVRVNEQAVVGTVIKNQLELKGRGEHLNEAINSVLSNDPTTNIEDDSTFSLVGEAALFIFLGLKNKFCETVGNLTQK